MIFAIVAALLMLAAAVNVGPELMAWALDDSIRAWEYVAEGAQAAALWLLVLVLLMPYGGRILVPAAAVCTYAAAEGALRAGCRLMFPMDRPPQVPQPEGLCTAAGLPIWWNLSPLALMLCATAVAYGCTKGKP